MNIREIAKQAGVSASTVSKVLNKKDQAISEETRQKVLAVVKENHYLPSRLPVGAAFPARSFLLGAVLQKRQGFDIFLETLLQVASREGYSVMTRFAETYEEERASIQALLEYPLEGMLLCGTSGDSGDFSELLGNTPYGIVDFDRPPTARRFGFDYECLGYQAAEELLEYKHRNIFCMIHGGSLNERQFVEGCRKCLQAKGLSLPESRVCFYDRDGLESKRLFENTGVLCFDTELAEAVYDACGRKNRRIPRCLSVVSLAGNEPGGFLPKLTALKMPFAQLAEVACRRLVSQIERPGRTEEEKLLRGIRCPGESVAFPLNSMGKKIVVVGSINMDTTIYLKDFPQVGRSALTNTRLISPGGKGLNQAVGVAKLEGQVLLIGKVGKDYEGSEIWDYLQSNGVDSGYVRRTSQDSTGHAYICVQEDGESGIMVYKGANALLTSQEVMENASAFEGAAYCLLQTELNMDVIRTTVHLAHKRGVKIILKPAAVDELDEEIYQMTDIFMPNEKESARLCPGLETCEEQADLFLERGVGQVIITRGSKGCYWSDGTQSQAFRAEEFDVVDTTGAADAFAAALAVFLAKGMDIRESIRRATVAAGFSTTKWGVSDALIDWDTLEFLCTARK